MGSHKNSSPETRNGGYLHYLGLRAGETNWCQSASLRHPGYGPRRCDSGPGTFHHGPRRSDWSLRLTGSDSVSGVPRERGHNGHKKLNGRILQTRWWQQITSGP